MEGVLLLDRNLLVPAWNLRFDWSCSCSEIRKGDRQTERGRGRGDVPLGTAVKYLLLSASVTHLVIRLQQGDMASPRHYGRSSVDIANVMQKLQGKWHKTSPSCCTTARWYFADSRSGRVPSWSSPGRMLWHTILHLRDKLKLLYASFSFTSSSLKKKRKFSSWTLGRRAHYRVTYLDNLI